MAALPELSLEQKHRLAPLIVRFRLAVERDRQIAECVIRALETDRTLAARLAAVLKRSA